VPDWTARYRQGTRQRLASRPAPIPVPSALGQIIPVPMATVGDVKAQPVRIADMLVFGPMMIYAGLGRATPKWVKVGMVIIGVGTIVYNLSNYFEVETRKREAGITPEGAGIEAELLPGLGGMSWGPMHKATDLHRPIQLVKSVGTNRYDPLTP
jgi:hypothetical protein